MMTDPTSQAFFDEKYREDDDPWQFASSPYELDRYAHIRAALNHRRYHRAFEPGCSVGVLTSYLAPICDHLFAIDISPIAARSAASRCRTFDNVTIRCGSLPSCIPKGPLDLVVLSEIGYYFDAEQLRALTAELVQRMPPSAVLLAAHWLGTSDDHQLSGDSVHTVLTRLPELQHEHAECFKNFRLDRWKKL